ncbi:glycerophosphodiester phosphodiesterase [Geodermatophilus sp. YIM 151500]|uniref:glycerophosphodiester phosphodiesterase n=1 Tax=Geodermatophilus sp. YIM 151500 TaxID=2984531 RepID=UPI0021E3E724|nr:glycerophosphodiester phosphodiesterase [Geodermatophilus sp. YIM 151500]MCV2492012.1 glycerophosphodiester phosphodiesterase [Geodermatophilus sp. YIM 151500]
MYLGNGSDRRGQQLVAEAQDILAQDILLPGGEGSRIQVLGHRGTTGAGFAENSVAAVTEALLLGADGVEVDVWLADGTLVCAHDLAPAARGSLATLTEVLAAAQRHPGTRVVVEAKPVTDAAVAQATADALADVLGTVTDVDITVSSFDPALLAMIRETCADLPVRTGLLGDSAEPAAAVVRRAHEDGHDEVHLPLVAVRRAPDAVESARRSGLTVTVWTVNRRPDLRWVAELGVDAVITDDVLVAWSEVDRPATEPAVAVVVAATA